MGIIAFSYYRSLLILAPRGLQFCLRKLEVLATSCRVSPLLDSSTAAGVFFCIFARALVANCLSTAQSAVVSLEVSELGDVFNAAAAWACTLKPNSHTSTPKHLKPKPKC